MEALHILQWIIAAVLLAALAVVYSRARKLHNDLVYERELLEALLNNIPDQIYFKDAQSRFVKVNPTVAKTLGMQSPEEAVGKTDFDFFRAEDAQSFRADDEKVVASGAPLQDRVERAIVSGAEYWLSTTKAPVFDHEGKPAGIVGISRDITERVRTQQQLANVVAKARCILWDARVTRIGDQFKWRIAVHSSDAICKEFGLDIAQKTKTMWNKQVDPEVMKQMQQTSRAAMTSGEPGYQQEFWIRADDGTPRWVKEDVQIARVSETEWDLVGVALDITERKRFEEQLAAANAKLDQLAREDTLTGLLNRRTLLELSEMEWARWTRFNSPFSVLMLDVDNFKQINDVHGHAVGDQALRLIAENLRDSIRNVDILGRYGGEEFLIVLPETAHDGAMTVANKALEKVRDTPMNIGAHLLNITISIGTATVDRQDRDLAALLNRADQALLNAKRNGKNRIVTA